MNSLPTTHTFKIAVIHPGFPDTFQESLVRNLTRVFIPACLNYEGADDCQGESPHIIDSDTNFACEVAEYSDFEKALCDFQSLSLVQQDRLFTVFGVPSLKRGKRFSPFASGCIPNSFRALNDESALGRFSRMLTQHGQGVCVSTSAITDLCQQAKSSEQSLGSLARNLSTQISWWLKKKTDRVPSTGWCWISDTGNREVRWPWGYTSSRAHISKRLLMPAEI